MVQNLPSTFAFSNFYVFHSTLLVNYENEYENNKKCHYAFNLHPMQGSELIPLSKFTSDPLSPGLWALQVAVQGTTIARWDSLCDEPIGCVCVCVLTIQASLLRRAFK